MTIRQRGGTYQVDITGYGQRIRRAFKSATAAALWEKQAEAALIAGRPLPAAEGDAGGPEWTLGTAFDRCYRAVWDGKASERIMALNGRLMLDWWGRNTPLDSVTPTRVEDWVEALKAAGNSDATINRKLSVLSRVLRYARDRGALRLGMPRIERRTESEGRIRVISPEEELTLLQTLRHLGKDLEADAVIVLLRTGLRCGELLKLTRDNVDLPRAEVSLWKTKNGRGRTVPLASRALEVLRRRVVAVGARDRLFPVDYSSLRYTWDVVRNLMGLRQDPTFTLHACRHTFCTEMVRQGIPLPAVQRLAGHLSIQTTMRYVHLSQADLDAWRGALEARDTAASAITATPCGAPALTPAEPVTKTVTG